MLVQKYEYKKLNRKTAEGNRRYTLPDGSAVPSVTTILSATESAEKKRMLHEWRRRVGSKEATRISTTAARIGTAMHSFLEEYALTDEISEPTNQIIQKHGHSMAKVIIDEGLQHLDECWGTESPLYHAGIYAGTTDLCGVWKAEESIVDFKQSNKPKKREWIDDYFVQLVAYGNAHNSMHGTNIKQGVVMMCNNPNSPKPYMYQEFVLKGKEWDKFENIWWDRCEAYYDL